MAQNSFAQGLSGTLESEEATVRYENSQRNQLGMSAEEQLKSECEMMWEDLNKSHGRLQSSKPMTGTRRDASHAEVLKCILKAKERKLQAEVLVQENEQLDVTSSHPEYVEALLRKQLTTTTEQLEETLSEIQRQSKEITNEIEREKEIVQQHREIQMVLLGRISDLEKDKENTHGVGSQIRELELKKKSADAYYVKVMRKLSAFMTEHFPSPSDEVLKAWGKRTVSGRNPTNTGITCVSLHQLVEDLMNRLYDKPHDPYIRVQDDHWPPYIELLLRFGIAERHKEDCNLIRLMPFHM